MIGDDSSPEDIRRALQCLAWTGERGDLPQIAAFDSHADEVVRRDARTCTYMVLHPRTPATQI